MMKTLRILSAAALFSLSAAVAPATTLTFDDLPPLGAGITNAAIPNGYGGLNWTNMHYVNGTTYDPSPNGYRNGRVSGDYVAYNDFANIASASSAPFTFNSVYLTGAWNNGLQVTVTGFNGASTLFTQTVTTSAFAPTLFTFNWTGIDRVSFTSFGGTPAPTFTAGSGTHFAMDNFTFNVPVTAGAPLPGTASCGLVLVAALGLARRRGAVA
jgi:hypothetical protein